MPRRSPAEHSPVSNVPGQLHRRLVQLLLDFRRQAGGGRHLHHLHRQGKWPALSGRSPACSCTPWLCHCWPQAPPRTPTPCRPDCATTTAAPHLLVAPLHGAVPLVQVHHASVVVCQDLHLDVPRILNIPAWIHRRIQRLGERLNSWGTYIRRRQAWSAVSLRWKLRGKPTW